jgi:hypothetical protein
MMRLGATTLAVLLIAASACGRRDNPNPDPGINPDVNPGAAAEGTIRRSDSTLALGPGDLQIANEDSSVDLAVVGQKIVVRLSDKTMAKVRRETDTSGVQGSGLGASIEKMVKRTVQSTLGQQYEYPLSDVRDARYENGAIVLDVNGKEPRLLANTKVGGKKLLESFRPEDAQRFVAVVNAKRQGGVAR